MAKLAEFPEKLFAAMHRIRETALVRFDSLFRRSGNFGLWSIFVSSMLCSLDDGTPVKALFSKN